MGRYGDRAVSTWDKFNAVMLKIAVTALGIVVALMLLAVPGSMLWNACMPALFNLPFIGYWDMVQLMGLVLVVTRPAVVSTSA